MTYNDLWTSGVVCPHMWKKKETSGAVCGQVSANFPRGLLILLPANYLRGLLRRSFNTSKVFYPDHSSGFFAMDDGDSAVFLFDFYGALETDRANRAEDHCPRSGD